MNPNIPDIPGISYPYISFMLIITMVTWFRWLSHPFQKLPQTLSSSSCQITPSQICYQKSSPPTSLPYHIGDPIFFEDSFIPHAFVNSSQRKERVAEFQATIPAKMSIPTIQLQVHRSRRCDHAQPQHVFRWARIKAKLCSYSCCWSIIKWLIQLTHLRAIKEITEVSLVDIPIVLLYDSTPLRHDSSLIHSISFLILLFSSLHILFYS